MDKGQIRKEIDSIDEQIVNLLARRVDCAHEIGKVKLQTGEDFYVPSREMQVFENLMEKNSGRIEESALKAIYREIISASISVEKKLGVAYLGPQATFTQQAALKSFGSSVKYTAMHSIPDIFQSVTIGEADYGVIPIENSTEGAVFHSMDMLAESTLMIVGQIYLPIEHCLISRGKIGEIRKVCSKDQAIGQCRNWLRRHMPEVELEYVESTALAVKMALENPDIAAIAGEIAATIYNIPVVEKSIQDKKDNETRFLVIGKKAPPKSDAVKYKTSIVISINDRPGALYDVLVPFNRENINLSRIESRPSKKKAWDYYFFIDFFGHWEDEPTRRAIGEMEKVLPMIKWLGSYPIDKNANR